MLKEFYEQWKDESLVVLKWLGIQTSSNIPGNLAAVKKLLDHPAVNLNNPNTNYTGEISTADPQVQPSASSLALIRIFPAMLTAFLCLQSSSGLYGAQSTSMQLTGLATSSSLTLSSRWVSLLP